MFCTKEESTHHADVLTRRRPREAASRPPKASDPQEIIGIYSGNYSLHLQGSSVVAAGAQAIAAELDGNGSLLVTDSELMADGTCALAGQIQLGSTRVGPGTVAGTTQTRTGVFRLGSTPEFFTDTCPGGALFASKSRIRIYEMGG